MEIAIQTDIEEPEGIRGLSQHINDLTNTIGGLQ
jgi:hypothetical protein